MKQKIVIITSKYLHPFVEKAFEDFKEEFLSLFHSLIFCVRWSVPSFHNLGGVSVLNLSAFSFPIHFK